jgi:hypothetical protein
MGTGFSENKGAPLYSENGILVTSNREPNIRGPPCIRHFGVSVLCKYVQIFLRNIRGGPLIFGAPLFSEKPGSAFLSTAKITFLK